jgi:ADP-ribosylglycohydrolase
MDIQNRIKLAKKSLLGLSIGDAFGESFFGERDEILDHIYQRKTPKTSWEFTDDTVMGIAVFEQLEKTGTINQNELIKLFVENHSKDVNRGYGATARRILREIEEGGDWKEISNGVFDGMGSMGNGAAMRVSPIGAFHFDDFEKVKTLTVKSAKITHSNIEAITGAIAVSIASALSTKLKLENETISAENFIQTILSELPDSDTKSKINKSLSVPYSYRIDTVKTILGNGTKIMAQDTVPFAIWCAAHNLNDFENALWKAVSILGDRDTICAIVGGITIMSSNEDKIPSNWLNSVENFEKSPFRNE